MKLANKLAIALLIGVLMVVSAFAAWRVRREVALLDEDVLRDHRMLSLTAAASVVRRDSRAAALEIVRRIDASRENLTVRFVSSSEGAPEELRPVLPISRGA